MSPIRYSTIAKSGPANPRNHTASVVELSNGELLVLWHKYEATRPRDTTSPAAGSTPRPPPTRG